MKILLVAPQYKPKGQYYELPLGLAYISSYLKSKKDLEIKFINLNEIELKDEDVKSADIFCTGGLSVHYRQVKNLLTKVKRINPEIITIVGGGLLSSAPEIVFEMLSPDIDIGIIGEGEELLYEVITNLNTAIYMIIVESMGPVKNLDSLPFPDYEGLEVSAYLNRQLCGDEHYLYPIDKPRCLPIISSRSCPFNCSFCFHPTGKVYRQRSLDNLFAEIEYLIDKYSINMVAVLDELISQFPERINLFCQKIKKYNLRWMTQMRVDSVNQDTINMLKDSGCFQISYGIEHVNQDILESYNKKTTLKQIENALEMTYEAGIGIQGNILFGGIKETIQTMQEAIKWRDGHLKYMINLTPVIPYPGTDLFKYGVENRLIDPQQYIIQGCPFINYANINLQLPIAFKFGTLLKSELLYKDSYRGDIKRIIVVCPHCKATVEYSGLYWGATGTSFTGGQSYRIGCRSCNQRLDIKKEALIL